MLMVYTPFYNLLLTFIFLVHFDQSYTYCPLHQDVGFNDECSDAPTPATRLICYQCRLGDNRLRYNYCGRTRTSSSTLNNADVTTTESTSLSQPEDESRPLLPAIAVKGPPPRETQAQRCRSLACLCENLSGKFKSRPNLECVLRNGFVLSKSIRKEYRMLTDEERTRFHNAIQKMKAYKYYDHFVYWHYQYALDGGAHYGPAFVIWHREFINRFEIALREMDPRVSLPYWDSVLDQNLPDSRDSILWSKEFMGGVDNISYVITEPYVGWRTIQVYNRIPPPEENDPEYKDYKRYLGGRRIQRKFNTTNPLFTEDVIQGILSNRSIHRIFTSSAAREGCPINMGWSRDYPYTLEVAHASIHNHVGGDFADPQLTANDPLFFVLHSFVDLIFEEWRQRHQTRESRNISYPAPDILCHTPDHYYYSPMLPFFGEDKRPIQNNDALGNIYTDEFYEYAPRPTCSQPKYDCGSKYLFCDRSHGSPRCASKIKIGGNCTGYNQGEEPCHNGQCKDNICVKIK